MGHEIDDTGNPGVYGYICTIMSEGLARGPEIYVPGTVEIPGTTIMFLAGCNFNNNRISRGQHIISNGVSFRWSRKFTLIIGIYLISTEHGRFTYTIQEAS